MVRKILVTGATGFIGNYVIQELLSNNCKVIATSSNGEKAKLRPWFSQVEYIPFNFKDFDNAVNYYSFFGYPDGLIHLAWEGLPHYKEAFHVEENLPRHFAFLKNMLENGLKDLTVAGTCFEYGIKEGCLSEEMECDPGNSYAIAKNELRKQLQLLNSSLSFDLKWVRLFYMYGRGQPSTSLVGQLDKALENKEQHFNMSGGEQLRDFLPIEKVAEHIVSIALQQQVTGIINCCSGIPVSVRAFVEEYLKERKKAICLNLGYYPYTDYEAMEFWGSNTKLKTTAGYD